MGKPFHCILCSWIKCRSLPPSIHRVRPPLSSYPTRPNHPLLASVLRKHQALRRLWQLLVPMRDHIPPQLRQNGLYRQISSPGSQRRNSSGIYATVALVHASHVDFGSEPDARRSIGILLSALDPKGVDATIMYASWRSNDGASPVCQELVVGILQPIANSAVAKPLFTALQLFQKSKIPWHHNPCHGVALDALKTLVALLERGEDRTEGPRITS